MIWRARRDPNLTRLAASARRRPSGSSDTKSGHFEESTLKKRHRNNLAACANEASKLKAEDKPFVQVRPFVFYNLRHTVLTRLGESGCDVWTLARIAGHSNISISQRYVHPSEAAVSSAMSRLGGHKIGHSAENADSAPNKKPPVSIDAEGVEWRARRPAAAGNSRPIAGGSPRRPLSS